MITFGARFVSKQNLGGFGLMRMLAQRRDFTSESKSLGRKFDHTKDYYEVLGVQKNASPREIRKAFFELAKIHHPDLSDAKRSKDVFQ